MSSTTTTRVAAAKSTSDANARRSAKTAKTSKIVRLTLSPSKLSQLEPNASSGSGSTSSDSPPSRVSTPKGSIKAASPTDTTAESIDAADAGTEPDAATAGDAGQGSTKKKAGAASKPGFKKAPPSLQNSLLRAKGRPGPRKKSRLDEIAAESSEAGSGKKAAGASPSSGGTHKLGPRANQGAINAGLRALDRSGKPCRRWEKKKSLLKSFTGVTWEVPSWKTYKPMDTNGEVATSNGKASQSGESDTKDIKVSSMPDNSEKSSNGMDVDGPAALSNGASSPAPAIASPA